jgi:hypothetical protein
MPRSMPERGITLEAAKRDIARRLRRVCAHFDQADFDKLVERIAEIDIRYRLRDEWGYLSPPVRPNLN